MIFASYILRRLIRGTVITLMMDSGNYIGPAVFIDFNPLTGIVTLEEQGGISPPSTSIIKVNSSKVEAIIYDAATECP